MIKLDIGELLRSSSMNYHYVVKETLPPTPDLDYASPVVGYLDFHRTFNLLILRGELEAAIRMECVRCLEEVIVPIQSDVEEEYAVENMQVVSNPNDEEGTSTEFLFEGNHLLMEEFIRQQLMLEREEFPLCAPDCLGLCPHCGVNLNEETCVCETVVSDPRLARLAELYSESNGTE